MGGLRGLLRDGPGLSRGPCAVMSATFLTSPEVQPMGLGLSFPGYPRGDQGYPPGASQDLLDCSAAS